MTKPKPVNALQAVLDRQARSVPQAPAMTPPVAPASSPRAKPARKAKAEEAPEARSSSYRPSRDGKRFVGGYFDPKVHKQLRLLSAEEDTSIEDLIGEALDLLFVKKGRGRIVRDAG